MHITNPTRRHLLASLPLLGGATVASSAAPASELPPAETATTDELARLATWDEFNERFTVAGGFLDDMDKLPFVPPLEMITNVMRRDLSGLTYPYRFMLIVRDKAGCEALARQQAGPSDGRAPA